MGECLSADRNLQAQTYNDIAQTCNDVSPNQTDKTAVNRETVEENTGRSCLK